MCSFTVGTIFMWELRFHLLYVYVNAIPFRSYASHTNIVFKNVREYQKPAFDFFSSIYEDYLSADINILVRFHPNILIFIPDI